MIQQFGLATCLVGGMLFAVFLVVEWVIWSDDTDCNHENVTTFPPKTCIDCLKEIKDEQN